MGGGGKGLLTADRGFFVDGKERLWRKEGEGVGGKKKKGRGAVLWWIRARELARQITTKRRWAPRLLSPGVTVAVLRRVCLPFLPAA